jgi:hypothetical protein
MRITVWVLYNEEEYGGGSDFIRVFNSLRKAENAINHSLNLEQVIDEFNEIRLHDGKVYVTYTEEWYGSVEVHSTIEEAERRIAGEDVHTLMIEVRVE